MAQGPFDRTSSSVRLGIDFNPQFVGLTLAAYVVTSVADSFRTSTFKFNSKGATNFVPPDVTGIEITDPDDPRVVDWQYDTTDYEDGQFSVIEERYVSGSPPFRVQPQPKLTF